MEELKENISYKDVELLSEEVQEVMSRIPSAIVRWGMTLMAVIVIGLFIASAYIRWPQIIECQFEWFPSEDKSEIIATLPYEALSHILSQKDIEITLYSPLFPSEYSENGVSGIITGFEVYSKRSDSYKIHLNIDINDIIIKKDKGSKIVGSLVIIIEDDTLLKNLIENIAMR